MLTQPPPPASNQKACAALGDGTTSEAVPFPNGKPVAFPLPTGNWYLGIRSWLREASLVSVVMSTVMTCGGHLGRVVEGRDWVTSKSRASRASKKLLICSTVHRRSQDTDRYSPMAHTWVGDSASAL